MRALTKVFLVVGVACLFLTTSCGTENSVTPVDTVPPVAPVGMALESEQHRVRISWAENAEPDLAGYNVYASSQAEGPFGQVNEDMLLCPWYFDSPTPMDVTYYRVTAVDGSGNESAYSQTMGIYFNNMTDRGTPSSYVE